MKDPLKTQYRNAKKSLLAQAAYPIDCNYWHFVSNACQQQKTSALKALAKRIYGNKWGVLFNTGALWVGVHYSPYNRRYCVNLLPCVTVWFTTKCGKAPKRAKL